MLRRRAGSRCDGCDRCGWAVCSRLRVRRSLFMQRRLWCAVLLGGTWLTFTAITIATTALAAFVHTLAIVAGRAMLIGSRFS